MEDLTKEQAALIAKAIATSWDALPPTEEQEFGPKTEAKAESALAQALESAEVTDAGVSLGEEQRADLLGQFKVYLDSADGWGDVTRMEAELAELFAAD